MYCLIEYHFDNASCYQKRKPYSRTVLATSLTETGIRKLFDEEYDDRLGERRWREGNDTNGVRWFSYRTMWITEVRLEQCN